MMGVRGVIRWCWRVGVVIYWVEFFCVSDASVLLVFEAWQFRPDILILHFVHWCHLLEILTFLEVDVSFRGDLASTSSDMAPGCSG
jgi:hypothetical protein